MAAFATFAAAETRAKAKMADGTWIVSHAENKMDGTIAVRLIRKMTSALTQGGWVELTDDGAV